MSILDPSERASAVALGMSRRGERADLLTAGGANVPPRNSYVMSSIRGKIRAALRGPGIVFAVLLMEL